MATQRKRSVVIREFEDKEAGIMSWQALDVRGDAPVPVGERIHLDLSKVSQANKTQAMYHGFGQRVKDAAALGQDATLADKLEAMRGIVDHLESGSDSWSVATARDGASLLLQACKLAFPGQEEAKLRAWIKSLKPAERAAVETSTKVKPHLDALRAERAADIDVEDLLGNFLSE